MVALQSCPLDLNTIAAVEISQLPFTMRGKDFGVMTAAPIVVDDDLIRWCATDGYGSSFNEPENIGPLGAISNDEVRQILFLSACL